jgi:hypothetical protein
MKDAIFKNPKGSVQLMMMMVAVIFLFVTAIATPSFAQRKGAVIPLIETKTNTVYITVNDPAPVGKTGQTNSVVNYDDGYYKKGIPSPTPRFTSANGTVTDHLTGLIWLQQGDCFTAQSWENAITSAHTLASGQCGLTDLSTAGMWRLPNIRELLSLVDYGKDETDFLPWSGFQSGQYWSSTTYNHIDTLAHSVHLGNGFSLTSEKTNELHVIAVRGGQ